MSLGLLKQGCTCPEQVVLSCGYHTVTSHGEASTSDSFKNVLFQITLTFRFYISLYMNLV